MQSCPMYVLNLELEHRNAEFTDLGQYCKVILLWSFEIE